MLDLSKPVQTRAGRTAKIFEVINDGSSWPIHGAYQDSTSTWFSRQWRHSGSASYGPSTDPYDLINVPETRTVWVNVYKDGLGASFNTKDSANNVACPDRIACIKVTYEVGEGL